MAAAVELEPDAAPTSSAVGSGGNLSGSTGKSNSLIPSYAAASGYATGLARVPYDNFPALLHEGERVLTAAEARGYNQGVGDVIITGNHFEVRQESDIDSIAQALLEKLRQAQMAGVG